MSQQKVLQHVFFLNKLLAQCHRWEKEGANNCEKQKNPKTQELLYWALGDKERENREREKETSLERCYRLGEKGVRSPVTAAVR